LPIHFFIIVITIRPGLLSSIYLVTYKSLLTPWLHSSVTVSQDRKPVAPEPHETLSFNSGTPLSELISIKSILIMLHNF